MSFLKYDQTPTKCKCRSCGKTWNKGDQDDNETICLRCEHVETSIDDQDYLDSFGED